jgi:transposase
LEHVPAGVLVIADRGYDSDAVRAAISGRGATPNIPPKVNRRFKPPFSSVLYRSRNAIERMFGRLKDFRRIATRYDKLARNFLAAVHIVATVCYWL